MTTVTQYPTTDTAVSGTWTTPTNVQADDGNTASVTVAAKNTTFERTQGGYGFDAAIPSGATINSVQLEVEHRVTSTGGIAFLENYGRISTTAGAINSDSLEPTTLTARTYANYARPGGGSWTRADLLDATFTTRVRARSGNNATSVTYHWDYIRVTVDYSASVVVTPSTVALALATFAPVVLTPVLVTAGLLALSLTTFAPTVTASGGGTTVTPSTAALTTSTFAPTVTVTDNKSVMPTTAALTTTLFAPTVTATANATATPGVASLTLTTFAPSVSGGYIGAPVAEPFRFVPYMPRRMWMMRQRALIKAKRRR